MLRTIDVAIIGAGQAGLAMSRELSGRGIEHLVLERGRVGERWRSERWDSLRLLTPNRLNRLPGLSPDGAAPGGFLDRSGVIAMLERYRAEIHAPVIEGVAVDTLRAHGGRFMIGTGDGSLLARAVVIATGACAAPRRPGAARGLDPAIAEVAPSAYRRPDMLPAGGVLVVGASATGIQLAAEIHASGRPVTLAVGSHVRVPRRYRGRDIMDWLDRVGFLAEPRDLAADPASVLRQPSLQLVAGQGDLDLALLAARGVRLVGRFLGAEGTRLEFAADLEAQCAAAERRRQGLLGRIDARLAAQGIPAFGSRYIAPPFLPGDGPETLDARAEGISTVIWATGFRRDYRWLDLPILGPQGELAQAGGITRAPGIFALGLPFMRHRASTFICGAGRDAAALAPAIATHLDTRRAAAA